MAIYQAPDPEGGFWEETRYYGVMVDGEFISFSDYNYLYGPYCLGPGDSLDLTYYEWFRYDDLPPEYNFHFVQFNIESDCLLTTNSCSNTTNTFYICPSSAPGNYSSTVQVCPGETVSYLLVPATLTGYEVTTTVNCASNTTNVVVTTNYSTASVTYNPSLPASFYSNTTVTGTITYSLPGCSNLVTTATLNAVIVSNTASNSFPLCDGVPPPAVTNGMQVCTGAVVNPFFMNDPPQVMGTLLTVTHDCGSSTNVTTNSFAYSAGPVTYSPALPASFNTTGPQTITASVTYTHPGCPDIQATLAVLNLDLVSSNAWNTNITCGGFSGGPTVTNSMQVCVNTPFTMPSLPPFGVTDGLITVTEVNCQTGVTNITTNAITYTTQIVYDPGQPPASFPQAGVTNDYTVKVIVTPSDTRCPTTTNDLMRLRITVVDSSATNLFCLSPGQAVIQGYLTPAQAQVCVGDSFAPNLPSVSFDPATVLQQVVNCQTNSTNSSTFQVSYTPGPVVFTSGGQAYSGTLGPFNQVGTYTFSASVTAIPSTNSPCPVPATTLGSITVKVVDTFATNAICLSAGNITSYGTLSATNAQACSGQSLDPAFVPFLSFPVDVSPATVEVTVKNCQTGSTTNWTGSAPYSLGPLSFAPPLPSVFNASSTHTAYVVASNPYCPTLVISVGSFTVNVMTNGTTNVVCAASGTVTNTGALSATSAQFCTNGSLTVPTLIANPALTPGTLQTTIKDCSTGNTTVSNSPVTYTFGPLTFDPQLPASFPAVGSSTHTAYVVAIPSDTHCAPFPVTVGGFTVNVVDTSATNVSETCAVITNPGSLTTNSLMVCLGGSIAAPGFSNLQMTNGYFTTNIVACGGTTNTTIGPVAYTNALVFNPPIFDTNYNLTAVPGEYTTTATLIIAPADPNSGCAAQSFPLGSVTVHVIELTISPTNFVVCAGTPVNFSVGGVPAGVPVTWSPAGAAPGGTNNSLTFTNVSTNQVVTVTVGHCSASVTGVVSDLTLTASTPTACKGSAITFTAQAQPPGLPFNWTVTGGQSTLSNGDSMNTVTFTNTGIGLPVTVSYGGCTQTVAVSIYSLTLTPTNFVTAAGVTNVFVANGEPPGLPYSWSEGSSTGPTNQVVFSAPTTNQQLTVTYGPCSQTAVGSVISLSLHAVSFAGPRHGVLKDDGSGEYPCTGTNYHWTATNSYPVCYTRNTTPAVWSVFTVAPTNYTGVVKIRANGPDGIDVPETEADLVYNGNLYAVLPSFVSTTAPLPDTVHFYDKMGLQWEYAIGSATDFAQAGSSSNQVYVTLRAPTNSVPVYHTVVHLSCKNAAGQTTDVGTADAVYSEFTDRVVRRLSDNAQMTYWFNNQMGGRETDQLLQRSDANGNCESWSALLRDCYRVQGMASDRIMVWPILPDKGVLVNDWAFSDPPSGSGAYPYTEGVDAFNLPGIEAQGNDEPPESFNGHWITLCNETYYDPSYGTSKVSGTDRNKISENNSFAGFQNATGGIRKNNTSPTSGSEVTYQVQN